MVACRFKWRVQAATVSFTSMNRSWVFRFSTLRPFYHTQNLGLRRIRFGINDKDGVIIRVSVDLR